MHYLLYTKYLCVGVSTTVWVWTYAHVHKNYLNNETEEKSDIQNSSIEWEDQAFKHGNGKSTRETSSTQLLLLFYLSFYSEVLFSPCVSFSRLISVYFELLMLHRRLMTLLSHLLVFLLLVHLIISVGISKYTRRFFRKKIASFISW